MTTLKEVADRPGIDMPEAFSDDGNRVLQVIVRTFTPDDLHLIAAAPDLLNALQAIVKSLADQDDEGMIEHAQQMIDARAAIAKATGEKDD